MPQPTGLTPSPLALNIGAAGQLTATLSPTPTASGSLSVTSSNTSIATVPSSVAFSSGQSTVTIPVTAVAPGSATITVSANGGQASATVNVNAPPSVSITAPLANTVYNAPATITVSANAADTDGTVTKVDFYQGATLIGTATVAPYSVQWANVAAGRYTLTAVATDNNGATTTSAPVAITVKVAVALYFIPPDHLGTPRLIADGNQNTVWRWDNQEPFGNDVPNDDPGSTGNHFDFPLRFPGQYYDRETNLAYNYFRDYDPATGRYVQSDPIGLRGGLNTFSYVAASPLGLIDPAGLEIVCKYVTGGFIDRTSTVMVKDEEGYWRKECKTTPVPSIGPPDPRELARRPPRMPTIDQAFDIAFTVKCYDVRVVTQEAVYETKTERYRRGWFECTDTCTGRKLPKIGAPDQPASDPLPN